MKFLLILLIVAFTVKSYSQIIPEKILKTEIKEVTVFLKGAQIFEAGNISLPAGKTTLKVINLSPYLDNKSIQTKATGNFTILSVNHKLNYLNELAKDKKTDSLRKILQNLELDLARNNARLEVLKEKLSLLNENKNIGGQQTSTSVSQLKQTMEYYDAEITAIKFEEITILESLVNKQKSQKQLQNQLNELNEKSAIPGSEIEILVKAEKPANASFTITYLVAKAGWFPKYDIRVKNINEPLELTYKAEVYQQTGIDWKNVKLRFSNGNPNESGVIPTLEPWNLNFARNTVFQNTYAQAQTSNGRVNGKVVDASGAPVTGATVMVKNSSIGTTTDSRGNYSITLPNHAANLIVSTIGYETKEVSINSTVTNIQLNPSSQALEEVVVMGYSSLNSGNNDYIREQKKIKENIITTRVIEQQSTVEIEVDEPYSISSNGEKLLVDLKIHPIKVIYEYHAIPKLDKDAFLIARIINWGQYNLLEGEANLYFEDAFIGRSILSANVLEDTLNISLGRDRNIVIGRDKNEEFTKKRAIGSNITETRGFTLTVRNKKSVPIQITLYDQIPVSVISDISVSVLNLPKEQLDDQTGQVTWKMDLNAQEQKEILFQYEVKYPKKERIILE